MTKHKLRLTYGEEKVEPVMTDEKNENITKRYFDNFQQLKDKNNRPLTNVYWSKTPVDFPSYGSIYLIHGYGGSPVEPCMKLPMQYAIQTGFDVVAIEGVDLSATATEPKNIEEMTLERQKQALLAGIEFCKTLDDINTSNKIAWVHSISCRALADLTVESPNVRDYFNEVVLNNPYFLAPPKVQKLHEKMMQKDPSGATWTALTKKSATMLREIERHTFKIPTCVYNLCIPLPPALSKLTTNYANLVRMMSHFVYRVHLLFILGTDDNMADYNQNRQLFNYLNVPHKQLVSINGANHSFENATSQYAEFARQIINGMKMHRTR